MDIGVWDRWGNKVGEVTSGGGVWDRWGSKVGEATGTGDLFLIGGGALLLLLIEGQS